MPRFRRIICALLFLAPTVSSATITAVSPAPRYNFKHAAWWFGRFDRHCAQAKAEGASFKVVFLGDSITENWEAPGTNVWNRHFTEPKYKALNLGFGGDRTENLLWRLRNGELEGLDPQVFVLLIGTNNTFFRTAREEPVADTVRGVAEILRTVQAKFPRAKVILHPIVPVNEKPDDEMRLRNGRISEQLRVLADGERVLWCDFWNKILEPDGTLTKEMSPDLTHPAARGYEIWAEALLPYLDWCLGYSEERPKDADGRCDSRAAFWKSALYGAKRDEIVENPAHFYCLVALGDRVPKGIDMVQTPNSPWLRFPFDFTPSVADVVWAVEDAGLCDGYSARVIVFSGDLWTADALRDGTETVLAGAKKLLKAVQERQPQARIELMPASGPGLPEGLNDALRSLADGERIVFGGDAL